MASRVFKAVKVVELATAALEGIDLKVDEGFEKQILEEYIKEANDYAGKLIWHGRHPILSKFIIDKPELPPTYGERLESAKTELWWAGWTRYDMYKHDYAKHRALITSILSLANADYGFDDYCSDGFITLTEVEYAMLKQYEAYKMNRIEANNVEVP